MSPKINETIWGRPPGAYLGDERIDMKPGEKFGDAVARHKANKAKAAKPALLAAPKQPTPNRRAAQDRNTEAMKALAADTAELRQAVEQHTPAAPKAEPAKERTGFAGKVRIGGGFRAFGAHEQHAE